MISGKFSLPPSATLRVQLEKYDSTQAILNTNSANVLGLLNFFDFFFKNIYIFLNFDYYYIGIAILELPYRPKTGDKVLLLTSLSPLSMSKFEHVQVVLMNDNDKCATATATQDVTEHSIEAVLSVDDSKCDDAAARSTPAALLSNDDGNDVMGLSLVTFILICLGACVCLIVVVVLIVFLISK